MIDLGKRNILGVRVNALDYEAAVNRIIAAGKEKQPLGVSALAVHGVMTGVLDPVHRYRLNHLELVLPDGQPVRWALNILHKTRLPDRVCGPDTMLLVCQKAAQEGLPIYLYGSRPVVLEALANNLCAKFPGLIVAGSQPSKFRQTTPEEKLEVIQQIKDSGAAITFVGLGCPRQEVWAYEYTQALSMPVMAVGAAFDFHAGLLSKAPQILSDLGLEWFYRLLAEPRRLWKRYLYLNPLYIWMFFLQWLNIRKYDPADATRPDQDMMYG
jgi:N-acetylglucosaminyldiphosphoundecaprenol N-acetyl-beta-D-mannosaminyltransferase